MRGEQPWEGQLRAWRDFLISGATPPSTVQLRYYHVARCGREVGKPPESVTLDDLTGWLARQAWSPNTRRAYRASLRAFYGWAMATGRVSSSPAHQLPTVRIPRSKPRPTPEHTYRRALAIADERERLAIMLAGGCGLRRGEVAQARREDVERDLLGWCLRVVGKGGHVRLVPLPDEVAEEVLRRPAGWLFPSPRGGHLTPHHLGKLVSGCLGGDLTMHTLRHRCGTVAYAATKDLRAVQELLGHAKPETTAIYTETPPASIRAAVDGAA